MRASRVHFYQKPITLLLVFFTILFFALTGVFAEKTEEAKENWKRYKTPEEAGFSSAKLLDAKAAWEDLRPERGSHAPDTFWYYNNWDFNTLGTIFEQETGTKIFEEYNTRQVLSHSPG